MPPEQQLRASLDEMQVRYRAMEAETALLAEQNAESQLLGSVSESLHASDDMAQIIDAALERISLLQDIAFCASGTLGSNGLFLIQQCYTSFTCDPLASDTLVLPGTFACPHAADLASATGSQCQALHIDGLFASQIFAPAEALGVALRGRSGSGRMFLFAVPDAGGRLARLGDFLLRLADLIAAKEQNLYLLQALQQLNQELEQKVQTRTAELTQREQLFRAMFEQASDGIVFLDLSGQVVSVNAAYARWHGYSASEMLQRGLAGVDFQGAALAQRMRTILNGEGVSFEVAHVQQDGQPLPLEAHAKLISVGSEPLVMASYRDIRERRRAEIELRIAATVFESQQGMTITDAERVILRVNQAFTQITGYSAAEAVGQNPRLLSSGRHDAAFYQAMWRSIDIEGTWQGEIWNRRKSGEVFPEWLTISSVKDAAERVTHYVATFADISSRKTADDEIKHLAFYDPLTNLPNRRLLLDRLDQSLTANLRHQRNSALLYVDLDNFKLLNDTLGHFEGDMLLSQVALRLSTCVREGDTVARLGSDEFMVMLEDLNANELEAASQAEAVGAKILASLNQDYQLGNGLQHSSASIGVTLFGGARQEKIEEPLKRAELAMFQAKAAGHNALRFFETQMQVAVTSRAALEADLREALLKNEFLLYYQPQVVGNARLTGAEALVRWQHPRRDLVSPLEFIALAEETGLILPLGKWVLQTACAQLAQWALQPTMAALTLAVNVSARQFHQKDFVDQVLGVIALTGANPKRLKLELTESLLVADVEDVIAKMNALKSRGVGFSLDDFGTGYSSLSYLKRLPLDQLKIDQSFVRNILSDPNDAAIARMVIALADSMGLAVIAEGVEMQAQADFLAHQGCHAYQGYFFSRPLPLAAFESFAATCCV